MRRYLICVVLVLAALLSVPNYHAYAQGGLFTVTTSVDITGAGAGAQFATSGTARWVQVIAQSGNGAVVRCGDASVSASRGLPIAAGGGFMFPPIPPNANQATNQNYYSLASLYCYVANSDKISVAWGN